MGAAHGTLTIAGRIFHGARRTLYRYVHPHWVLKWCIRRLMEGLLPHGLVLVELRATSFATRGIDTVAQSAMAAFKER